MKELFKKKGEQIRQAYKNLTAGKSPKLGIWILIVFGCLSLFVFPYLFTRNIGLPSFTETNPIADTINGISSPFIALVAAFLTFLAFWVQFQANQEQKKQFKQQGDDIAIQRFENRYFEMIRIHRDNVRIINERDQTTRKDLFITMFFELRFIYNYAKNLAVDLKINTETKIILSDKNVFDIAYNFFYSGANPDTHRTEISFFKGLEAQLLFSNLNNNLKDIRDKYRFIIDKLNQFDIKEDNEYKLSEDKTLVRCQNEPYCFTKSNSFISLQTKNEKNENAPIYFWLLREPFTGHVNELGPYFQHLLQTLKYLDGQKDDIFLDEVPVNKIIPENKYSYFKLLRAQLSTYELLLIFYHSLSVLNGGWVDANKESLLKKYKFLKKLPIRYADFYLSPETVLGKLDSKGNLMFDNF